MLQAQSPQSSLRAAEAPPSAPQQSQVHQAAHAEVKLAPGGGDGQQEQQQQQQSEPQRPAQARAPIVDPFAAAQQRMQVQCRFFPSAKCLQPARNVPPYFCSLTSDAVSLPALPEGFAVSSSDATPASSACVQRAYFRFQVSSSKSRASPWLQASGVTSPTPETANPAATGVANGDATSAKSAEDTLSPLTAMQLNPRASRLAAMHANSPSATMSFAKLGTRSEGGWSATSPTPAGPSPYAASLASKVRGDEVLLMKQVEGVECERPAGPSPYAASLVGC